MPSTRQILAASVLRFYPFYSGCGALANHKMLKRLTGDSSEAVWAKVAGGEILAPLDDHVGRAAYFIGDLDRKVTWICRRLVKPGDTVLDIGANIGLVTILLRHLVGERGRVLAFEPNPNVHARLRAALDRADAKNVDAYTVALGDAPGNLELVVPQGNSGAGSLAMDAASRPGSVTHQVEVRTLANVLDEAEVASVQFIKIDVEGFEAMVLEGARGFFEKSRPGAILFENNIPAVLQEERSVFTFLNEFDYAYFSVPRCFASMHLDRFDASSKEIVTGHDFLAVPKENFEAVAAKVGAR